MIEVLNGVWRYLNEFPIGAASENDNEHAEHGGYRRRNASDGRGLTPLQPPVPDSSGIGSIRSTIMNTTSIELSEDAFAAMFRPLANQLNSHASFDWGAGYGTLFETYGEELDYVRSQDPAKIWTLQSGDGDFITSGYHLVNRVGYFVTEVPLPAGLDILVTLPEPLEDASSHVLPPRIAESLRQLLEYVWKDEHRDYHATDPCTRRDHIFRSIWLLRNWLHAQESMDTSGGQP